MQSPSTRSRSAYCNGSDSAENDIPALRGILERAVPKNRGAEFLDLLEELAFDTCLEAEPQCSRCELRKICAYALSHKEGKPTAAAAA